MERFGSFNISHVTLYRCMSLIQTTLRKSFNTSHVTLYRLMQNSYQATSPFQYISCYSLSESEEAEVSEPD